MKIRAQTIRYHVDELIRTELLVKEGEKYLLSEVFYLGNGKTILEMFLDECTKIMEVGLKCEDVVDKSLMIDLLKLIFEMTTSMLEEK